MPAQEPQKKKKGKPQEN
jgi:hypothetical protein